MSRLPAFLNEYAAFIGAIAVAYALLQHLVLRKAYPGPPAGNRGVVVVTGAHRSVLPVVGRGWA